MSEASSQDSATSPMATTNNGTTAAQPNSGAAVVTTPNVANNTTTTNQNNVIVVTSTPSSGATVVSIPAASVVTTPMQMQGTAVQIQTTVAPSSGTPTVGTVGTLRPQQMTAPMQVIQSNQQYLQHYTIQQQLMLQNAAVQAAMQGITTQQLNLNAMQQQQQQQNRPSSGGAAPKSPSIMSPTGGVVIKSSNSSPITVNPNPLMSTGVNVKGTGTIVSQATPQIGGKSIMQRQNSQPLVIGQLGVLSNPTVPVSSHQLVNQSKSPTLTTQAQVLPNTAQIRLTSQQTLVTNTGQIINTGQPTMIANPAIMNHLQFSPHLMSQETLRAMALQQNQLGQQSLLTSQQAATILSSQPLYIRAATPLQHQLGNVQNVMPATSKGKIDVAPANVQIKASLMGPQKVGAGVVTKGTTHVLPSVTRVVNQAGTPLVTAQVQPTNMTLTQIGRTTLPQQKQVNRVKGLKSHSKPSSPVPSGLAQARIQVQTKSTANSTNTQDLPTVMVQPKVQQVQQQPQPQPQPPAQQQQLSQPQHPHQNHHPQHQHHTQPQQQQQPHHQQLQQQQQQQQQQTSQQEQKKDAANKGLFSKTEKTPTPPPVETVSAPKMVERQKPVSVNHNGVNGKAVNGEEPAGSEGSPMETDAPDDGGKDDGGNPGGNPPPGEKQKAIVKPNVLTHIIEGFVIEEGPEPFPVQRSSLLTEFIPPKNMVIQNDSDSCDNSKDNSSSTESKQKKDKTKKGPIVVESDDFTLPSWDLLEDFDEYDDKPRLKCEFCGKIDYAFRFKGSKRFCSMACAKRYNVGCSKRMGLFQGRQNGPKHQKKKKNSANHRSWSRESGGRVTTGPIQRCASEGSSATTASTASEATSGEDEQNSTLSPHESSPPRSPPVLEREGDLDPTGEPPRKRLAQQWSISTDSGSDRMSPAHLGSAQVDDDVRSTPEPRKPISKWSVQDVYEFIHSLAGCTAYANDFRSQEIDGQALLLLKEDHLMTAMSMKLGPALKICARINTLKDEMS